MNIAIATQGREAHSLVPAQLDEAGFLFIVDVERFEVTEIIPGPAKGRDIFFAQQAVDHACEAILCGEIQQEAFEVLAKASVSRYNATGETATQAVRKMNAYQLPLIREYQGGPGCAGEHVHQEHTHQECHEHED